MRCAYCSPLDESVRAGITVRSWRRQGCHPVTGLPINDQLPARPRHHNIGITVDVRVEGEEWVGTAFEGCHFDTERLMLVKAYVKDCTASKVTDGAHVYGGEIDGLIFEARDACIWVNQLMSMLTYVRPWPATLRGVRMPGKHGTICAYANAEIHDAHVGVMHLTSITLFDSTVTTMFDAQGECTVTRCHLESVDIGRDRSTYIDCTADLVAMDAGQHGPSQLAGIHTDVVRVWKGANLSAIPDGVSILADDHVLSAHDRDRLWVCDTGVTRVEQAKARLRRQLITRHDSLRMAGDNVSAWHFLDRSGSLTPSGKGRTLRFTVADTRLAAALRMHPN